jgi:hypothetical protein
MLLITYYPFLQNEVLMDATTSYKMNKLWFIALIILTFAIVIAFIISMPQVQTTLLFPNCTKTPHNEASVGYLESSNQDNPVIIHFHGNVGTAQDAMDRLHTLRGHKYFVEYPGYSEVANAPMTDEGHFWQNMLRIYTSIVDKHPNKTIILSGRSIGTGVVYGLTKHQYVRPHGIILETPVSSMSDLTDFHFKIVGKVFKSLVAWSKMDYHKSIHRCPILVLGGEQDNTTNIQDVYRDYKDTPNVTMEIDKESGHRLPHKFVLEKIQQWMNLHAK